jgi:hypothetical protein
MITIIICMFMIFGLFLIASLIDSKLEAEIRCYRALTRENN